MRRDCRFIRRCLLGLFTLQLSACTHFYALTGSVEQRVDEWVAQQRYREALALIDLVRPSDSDYAALMRKRELLLEDVARLRSENLKKAKSLQGQNKWAQAGLIYAEMAENLPDSSQSDRAYTEFLAGREQFITRLNRRLNLAKGRYIGEEKRLYQRIYDANPTDPIAERTLEALNNEVLQVAASLRRHGEQALAEKNYPLAERCLTQAHQLAPSADIQSLLASAQAKLRARKKESQRAEQIALTQHYEKLSARYNEALLQGDLQGALTLLGELTDRYADWPDVQHKRDELNDLVAARVSSAIEQGETYYTKGELDRALAIWREVLPLAPHNSELTTRISRAERFLKKVERLKGN